MSRFSRRCPDPASPVKAGEKARFAIKTDGIQFFDPQDETAIWS